MSDDSPFTYPNNNNNNPTLAPLRSFSPHTILTTNTAYSTLPTTPRITYCNPSYQPPPTKPCRPLTHLSTPKPPTDSGAYIFLLFPSKKLSFVNVFVSRYLHPPIFHSTHRADNILDNVLVDKDTQVEVARPK